MWAGALVKPGKAQGQQGDVGEVFGEGAVVLGGLIRLCSVGISRERLPSRLNPLAGIYLFLFLSK